MLGCFLLKAVAGVIGLEKARYYDITFQDIDNDLAEKAEDWNLKRGGLERRKSCRNSLLNIATGHINLLVAAKIICTQVYSVSVLLCFSCRIVY